MSRLTHCNWPRLLLFILTILLIVSCKKESPGFMKPDPPTHSNQAPSIINIALFPLFYEGGLKLIVTGKYIDDEGDEPDVFIYKWKKNGNIIEVGNSYEYFIETLDEAKGLWSVCVTPIAKSGVTVGKEICVNLSNGEVIDSGEPPPKAYIYDEITPIADEELSVSYIYDANGSRFTEGDSVFGFLYFSNGETNFPEIDKCENAKSGTSCIKKVRRSHLNKPFSVCVVPIDQQGQLGAGTCKTSFVRGLSISGVFEYGNTLRGHMFGIKGEIEWRADLTNHNGHDGDINLTKISEEDGGSQKKSLNIGTLQRALSQQSTLADWGTYEQNTVNTPGVIDDWDWINAGKTEPLPKDATFFIGKNVQFCVLSNELGRDICVDAATMQDYSEVTGNVSLCKDQLKCVVGGAYYEGSHSQMLFNRGIEPIRTIRIGQEESTPFIDRIGDSSSRKTMYFSRPLTVFEAQHAKKLGLGSERFPDPYPHDNEFSYLDVKNFGYRWAIYRYEQISEVCSNLEIDRRRWYLPIAGDDGMDSEHFLRGDGLSQGEPLLEKNVHSISVLFRGRLALDNYNTSSDPDKSWFESSLTTGWTIPKVRNATGSDLIWGDTMFFTSSIAFGSYPNSMLDGVFAQPTKNVRYSWDFVRKKMYVSCISFEN